ncbi:acyl-CoA dehydrogenase/oxidase [Ilyonectria robusta]|uniref:acyl-CoA dehydrogenase/oxidase n=1 Tax=Ilyonectria robusta TaxID=1079257 RepID=UPI001E8ECD2E|nr:acyl-CoA dehydrogenase/oxidase [Ilyonectria robusta]KAH8666220.1 acyl-CoA dehydrogenase/oxidase [Ilyonectria robusta]
MSSTTLAPFADPLWYTRGNSPYYKESHIRLRDEVREYVSTHIAPNCEEWEKNGAVPLEASRHYAEAGFMAASIFPLPVEYLGNIRLPGGVKPSEWDEFHDLVFMDEVARCGYLGVFWGLACGNIIGAPPIFRFGTDSQKQKYVGDILSGKTRFCLAVTEPDAGSDVAGLTTTAVRNGNKYVVNGAKKWITNGLWADYCTAAVRTGGLGKEGISVLIIPLDAPGVTRKRIYNSGVSASGSTYIEFDDVEVPVENLIGEENRGFPIIMSNFNHERIWLAITALRLARVCAEDSYLHAIKRETFGKKLITNQVIRAKLSTAGRSIDSAHAYLEQLVFMQAESKRRNGCDPVGIGGLIANCKVLAGQVLERTNREAQQIMGGVGYSRQGRGSRVEQISRDLRVMVVGGGSEEILTELSINQEAKTLAAAKL